MEAEKFLPSSLLSCISGHKYSSVASGIENKFSRCREDMQRWFAKFLANSLHKIKGGKDPERLSFKSKHENVTIAKQGCNRSED